MTFQEIYNEVIGARFKSSQLPSAKRWVNLRYAQIWAAVEWPWKIVDPVALTITAGDTSPAVPDDIQTPLAIYDDFGAQLTYHPGGDFDILYQNNTSSTRPTAYKWNNGVLTVGSSPNIDYAFSISYLRKLSHFDNLGAVTVGPMSEDDDSPIFASEWHEILVLGALATGLKVENDPTWESLEQEFGIQLGYMSDLYLPAVAVAGNQQYGADGL